MSTTGLAAHFSKLDNVDLTDQSRNYCLRFIRENHYFYRACENPPQAVLDMRQANKCRLTSMYSGSVHFPYEARHEVLKHIAYDVQTKNTTKSFWNQMAYEDEGVRLVVDIDTSRVLSPAELDLFGTTLADTLTAYYPRSTAERPIDVVCSVCGPRPKKGVQSSGVHMVCHVQTTFEQARQIIFGFKLRLHMHRTLDLQSVVVDAGIYKTNVVNLRMIYNHKIETCPLCEDDRLRRITCSFCDRSGLATSNHVYTPFKCFQATKTGGVISDDRFRELHANALKVVTSNSIWAEDDDKRDDYTKPNLDPHHACDEQPSGQKDAGGARKRPPTAETTSLPQSNQAYELLRNFLWDVVFDGIKPWDGILITDIKLNAKGNSATVVVDGMGSRWCIYAKKVHNNRIYFTINKKSMLTVHCHSDKYNCKQKSKHVFDINQVIANYIFTGQSGVGLSLKRVCLLPSAVTDLLQVGETNNDNDVHRRQRLQKAKENNFKAEIARLSAFYKQLSQK